MRILSFRRAPSHLSLARVPLLLTLAAGALSPAVDAQVDFLVSKIEVNQSIQTGATPMVGGRSTFVRAVPRMVNAPPLPQFVDGLLRVYVNGVEVADSPVYSDNGPFAVVQPANLANENDTLNFIVIAPTAANVTFEVEINPAGPNFIVEANTTNNFLTTPPMNFAFQSPPDFAYAPIDYRPSGGSVPNLPDPNLIAPGIGDGFLQGIYPAADWYYHRQDAPSKLWTSSLSGSGSALNTSLTTDINLMVPKPDFLYGWVPGPLPGYNGQAIISGQVAMGNTELIRFQRTMAHELGHVFGLSHNVTTNNLIGVDVEYHLAQTQNLPQIKAASLKDIMYAGLLTQEAWVATGSYGFFYNHFVFNDADADASDGGGAADGPAQLVSGLWNTATGEIELLDMLVLPSATPTPAAPPGLADLRLAAYSGGGLLLELPIAVRDSLDDGPCLDGEAPGDAFGAPTTLGFHAIVPLAAGAQIDRLVLAQAGARPVATLDLPRSAAAPSVRFTAPVGVQASPLVHVAWEASDADGDALTYFLRYSPDGERMVPVATSTSVAFADVDVSQLPRLRAGVGFFELFASDGLNTTVVRSEPLQPGESWAGSLGNAPWVEIYHPDHGFTFRKGASVVLHSSGWDIEDRALTGGSIVWTSSLDGVIGTGRLLAVNDLSVGLHVITVTATDSDLQTVSDAHTINITDRGLPDIGGAICQPSVGFGGPGSAVLSVCGGDLSTGTNATVSLTGAPANTTAFAVFGLVNGQVAFKGGTLVPVPWLAFTPLTTNGAGAITLNGAVPGGGGPFSAWLQFAIVDGAQAQGFGLSNAVRLDFLP